jgi:chromosome segregation ATPase
MDDQQQQRINRAAQEFTDALVAAYTTTADSNVVAQQIGAQQIEYFFNTVISNLRTQAEGTSQLTQQLADQQRLAREATRDLTQLSTDNYMDLLDSMFSFYQGGTSRTQRRAEEAQRQLEEAEARAGQAQRRAEEAASSRSEAEKQTEEVKRSTEQAQTQVKEAQKSARTAQKRAEEAERSLEEAKGRTEQAEERAREAERRAEEAQGRSQETERSLEEAQGRTVEAERRAQEAERSRSEAPESQGEGSEEGDTKADAVRHPLSTWVRTSGRSKVRGRNTRSQGRSSRRR